MENDVPEGRNWLQTDPSSNSSLSAAYLTQNPLDISTRCEKCQEDLDGPCFEHADIKRIIYDKPPVPLAHSSLPDALGMINLHPLQKDQMIFAKQKIEARTLFGPLIAPLVPLEELKGGPPRYTLWSEETQELQVYDLSDDFLCNWIKFIRRSASLKEANVIAYQQRGSIYLVAVRDILPSTEMRVYVKTPRCSTIPKYQLSLFVQSLLASHDKEKLEECPAMDAEPEITEKPMLKRKRVTRSKRTKNVAPLGEGSISNELPKNSLTCPEVSAVESQTDAEVGHQAAVVYSTELSHLMGKKRVSREWSLLNRRYKSGDMTEDEKRNFENDETTIEQRKKEEVRKKVIRQNNRLRLAKKVAKMTTEEREAYLAQKRVANIRNAPTNNKLSKLVREKFLSGLTLTPEELVKYEEMLERSRGYNARKREKKRMARIAEGKDPDAKRHSGGRHGHSMFGWQIAQLRSAGDSDAVDTEEASEQPFEERTSSGRPIPTFRLKIRQGIPLTTKDQAAYQKWLTRNREDNRAYYRRRKIAKGLEPKEMPSRRKAPFEKGKNSTGGIERKSRDDAGSSSEEPSDGSDSQESESHGNILSI